MSNPPTAARAARLLLTATTTALLLAACGGSAQTADDPGADPALGACAEGVEDCSDAVVDGSPARCTADAVDCDDTPAGDGELGPVEGECAEGVAACDDTPAVDPAAGACLVGDPDCADIGDGTDGGLVDPIAVDDDPLLDEPTRVRAAVVLGMTEEEVGREVETRVARRGEEQFDVTEDYRIGRLTVELDEVDGVWQVTVVHLELSNGIETIGEPAAG